MTRLNFTAEWHGERAAGINPGYEEIQIVFRYGQPPDPETIAYWKDVVAEFYDGAKVTGGVSSERAETRKP